MRISFLAPVLLAILVLLAACGGAGGPGGQNTPTAGSTAEPTPGATGTDDDYGDDYGY